MAETKPATIKPPLQQKAPTPPVEPEAPVVEPEAVVERISFGGIVMQKTVDTETGAVETKVLKQPEMSAEEIRATRQVMRSRGAA